MNKNPVKLILEIFLTVFVLSCAANAATLSEYRDNIKHLKEDLNLLIASADSWTDEYKQNFINEIHKELPEIFPPKEKIEWQGEAVETDNEWLINKFTSFKDLEKN